MWNGVSLHPLSKPVISNSLSDMDVKTRASVCDNNDDDSRVTPQKNVYPTVEIQLVHLQG